MHGNWESHKTIPAIILPKVMLGLLALSMGAWSLNLDAPLGSTVNLVSQATGKYVVIWNDGAGADIHASALHPDERAAIIVEDAGEGWVALRSGQTGAYWDVSGTGPDMKVRCNSNKIGEVERFAWLPNGDGTVSFRSKANGRFVSVVGEDTTIVPAIDAATMAAAARQSADVLVAGDPGPSLVVTEEMMKPYTVRHFVLRAASEAVGEAEKFRADARIMAGGPLAKSGGVDRESKVLTFLNGISGKKTISGIHNREPNSNPAKWTNWINSTTGKYPGLWGGDFLYSSGDQNSRATMITMARTQWSAGSVVSLMYHMCPPSQGEACGWNGGVQSKLSDSDWTLLITDGTDLNKTYKARMRSIGTNLQMLKDAGVEVLFRPLHEMNQGAFWWGGRTGANGTSRLFQITHDYLVDSLGLTNVFFLWSVQDLSWNFQDYNPGDKYWDLMTLDVYNGDGFTLKKYNAMLDVAGDRLIGIAETGTIPSSATLLAQPRWVYFSGWAELVQSSNSTVQINDAYTASNILSRDRMPGWGDVTGLAGLNSGNVLAKGRDSGLENPARKGRFILGEGGSMTISLHDSRGRFLNP